MWRHGSCIFRRQEWPLKMDSHKFSPGERILDGIQSSLYGLYGSFFIISKNRAEPSGDSMGSKEGGDFLKTFPVCSIYIDAHSCMGVYIPKTWNTEFAFCIIYFIRLSLF